MNIVVCMKQVPDPEGPPTSFEILADEMKVAPRGLPPVANPYDENALEAALRIKDSQGARITLLTMGKSLSRAVLLKAMGTGVDDAVLIDGSVLDAHALDSYTTARLLAAALCKTDHDLILAGRQASDTNAGQVGLLVAQLLGIPAIAMAGKLEISDGRVRVESIMPDGFALMEAPLPALVTVSHEVGELRYPSLAAIRDAKKLPVATFSPSELDVDLEAGPMVEIVGLAEPVRERSCRMVSGETPAEAGEKLAEVLHSQSVV